jgi:aminodeoxychorismate synthase component I
MHGDAAWSAEPLPREADWLGLVAGLRARPGFWWLDSSLAGAPLGRFSFAGTEPVRVVRARDARDVESALAEWMPARVSSAAPASPALPFVGGAVALLGYELDRGFDRVPAAPDEEPLPFPAALLLAVDRLYAFDHAQGRGYAVAFVRAETPERAERGAREAARALAAAAPGGPFPAEIAPLSGKRARADAAAREQHAKAVEQILAQIAAGELYQACLTRRIALAWRGDPFRFYAALRAASPAPFGAYLALDEGTIAGSSPERFLSCTSQGWLETRPIKGTRPRAADAACDARLRAELAASAKDRAENLMIADLARNDLGRVCETGSVHVPELFAVESYAQVHQLVSTVRGRLAPGRSALDAILAAFPPGSMTGAPKLAAMASLARLERARRGLYAGALGYLDARGGFDLAVVIRTAFFAGERIAIHTGGGIVADSDPAAEWEEAETKVRALLACLDATRAPSARESPR